MSSITQQCISNSYNNAMQMCSLAALFHQSSSTVQNIKIWHVSRTCCCFCQKHRTDTERSCPRQKSDEARHQTWRCKTHGARTDSHHRGCLLQCNCSSPGTPDMDMPADVTSVASAFLY